MNSAARNRSSRSVTSSSPYNAGPFGSWSELFRESLRVFNEHLPALYFAAPRVYVAVSARLRNLAPALTPPPLMWSVDTLSVVPASDTP